MKVNEIRKINHFNRKTAKNPSLLTVFSSALANLQDGIQEHQKEESCPILEVQLSRTLFVLIPPDCEDFQRENQPRKGEKQASVFYETRQI